MRKLRVKVSNGTSYQIKGVMGEIEHRGKYKMTKSPKAKKNDQDKFYLGYAEFEDHSNRKARKLNKQSQYRKNNPRQGARKS